MLGATLRERAQRGDPRGRPVPGLFGPAPPGARARAAGVDPGPDRRASRGPAVAFVLGRRPARTLPQDLRGLRPHLRLLRDPADAREAPLGAARAPGARSAAARGPGSEGDQPRGAGPRPLRARPGSRWAQAAGPARGAARRDVRALVPPAVRLLGRAQPAARRPDRARAPHRALHRHADPARERPHARADAPPGAPAHHRREAGVAARGDSGPRDPHDLSRGVPGGDGARVPGPDRLSRGGPVRPAGRVRLFAAGGDAGGAVTRRRARRGQAGAPRGAARGAAGDLRRAAGAVRGARGGGPGRSAGRSAGRRWHGRDARGPRAVAGGRRGRRHLPVARRLGRRRELRAGAARRERGLRLPGGRADVSRSGELFDRAKQLMPGGVSSPVRAFRAVGGTPFFVTKAAGCRLTDADGKSYVDYVCSWGPLILGHAHPAVLEAGRGAAERGWSYGAPCEGEVRLAEMVCRRMPSIEMVRFVSSGTEATMAAVRVARAATRRDLVLKFEGCYHRHAGGFL